MVQWLKINALFSLVSPRSAQHRVVLLPQNCTNSDFFSDSELLPYLEFIGKKEGDFIFKG